MNQPFNMNNYMDNLCKMDGAEFAKTSLPTESLVEIHKHDIAIYIDKYQAKAKGASESDIARLEGELGCKIIALMGGENV